jgi:hypothetical protein
MAIITLSVVGGDSITLTTTEGAEISLNRDSDQPISLSPANGKSAYQSYLSTTDDDPPLSEAQWSLPLAEGSLDLSQHYGTLDDPSVTIDGGLL